MADVQPLKAVHYDLGKVGGLDAVASPPYDVIDAAERARRQAAWFTPFHGRVAAFLDARPASVVIGVHSFTPVYAGCARPWQVGVLYGRDARLATIVLDALRREPGLCVGENLPYDVSDETDYAVPVHGEARGLPHVELELRQDLIAQPHGQRHWARRLATLLAADEARIAPLDLPRGG